MGLHLDTVERRSATEVAWAQLWEWFLCHGRLLNNCLVHQAFAFCFFGVLWKRKLWEFPLIGIQQRYLLNLCKKWGKLYLKQWGQGGSAAVLFFFPMTCGVQYGVCIWLFYTWNGLTLTVLPAERLEVRGGAATGHLTRIFPCYSAAAGCSGPTHISTLCITWSFRSLLILGIISFLLCFSELRGQMYPG